MDIGHSRLLKYLDTTKMSKATHKLHIENLNPSSIESEVPVEQELRKGYIANDNEDSIDEVENGGTFVPVYTHTKEETSFEKGDVKLHKVTVKENISDEEPKAKVSTGADYKTINNPLYSSVHGELIPGPQKLRESVIFEEKEEHKEEHHEEDKKPKTRIPVSRFKQVADKVKEDRRPSNEKTPTEHKLEKEKEAPKTGPRRSSIPKLHHKPASHPPQKPPRFSKEGSNAEPKDKYIKSNKSKPENEIKQDSSAKTKEVSVKEIVGRNVQDEDEFEKLYEEIADNNEIEAAIGSSLLNNKVDDPEKVEHIFEDIIHAYDDDNMPAVVEEKGKSKIPMLKRRSEHEIVVPTQLRRSSLKNPPSVEKEKLKNPFKKEPNVKDVKNDTINQKSPKAKEPTKTKEKLLSKIAVIRKLKDQDRKAIKENATDIITSKTEDKLNRQEIQKEKAINKPKNLIEETLTMPMFTSKGKETKSQEIESEIKPKISIEKEINKETIRKTITGQPIEQEENKAKEIQSKIKPKIPIEKEINKDTIQKTIIGQPIKHEENKSKEIQSTIKPEIPIEKEITKEETIQKTFKGQPIKQEENKSQEIQSDIKPKKPIEKEINKDAIQKTITGPPTKQEENKAQETQSQFKPKIPIEKEITKETIQKTITGQPIRQEANTSQEIPSEIKPKIPIDKEINKETIRKTITGQPIEQEENKAKEIQSKIKPKIPIEKEINKDTIQKTIIGQPIKHEENKSKEIQSTIKPEIPIEKEITKEETIQKTFKSQPIKQEENKSQEIQSDIKPKKPIEKEINKDAIQKTFTDPPIKQEENKAQEIQSEIKPKIPIEKEINKETIQKTIIGQPTKHEENKAQEIQSTIKPETPIEKKITKEETIQKTFKGQPIKQEENEPQEIQSDVKPKKPIEIEINKDAIQKTITGPPIKQEENKAQEIQSEIKPKIPIEKEINKETIQKTIIGQPTKHEENKAQEIQSTIKPEIPIEKEITKDETIQKTFKRQPIKQEENKSQEIQSEIKPKIPIEKEINKETIQKTIIDQPIKYEENKTQEIQSTIKPEILIEKEITKEETIQKTFKGQPIKQEENKPQEIQSDVKPKKPIEIDINKDAIQKTITGPPIKQEENKAQEIQSEIKPKIPIEKEITKKETIQKMFTGQPTQQEENKSLKIQSDTKPKISIETDINKDAIQKTITGPPIKQEENKAQEIQSEIKPKIPIEKEITKKETIQKMFTGQPTQQEENKSLEIQSDIKPKIPIEREINKDAIQKTITGPPIKQEENKAQEIQSEIKPKIPIEKEITKKETIQKMFTGQPTQQEENKSLEIQSDTKPKIPIETDINKDAIQKTITGPPIKQEENKAQEIQSEIKPKIPIEKEITKKETIQKIFTGQPTQQEENKSQEIQREIKPKIPIEREINKDTIQKAITDLPIKQEENKAQEIQSEIKPKIPIEREINKNTIQKTITDLPIKQEENKVQEIQSKIKPKIPIEKEITKKETIQKMFTGQPTQQEENKSQEIQSEIKPKIPIEKEINKVTIQKTIIGQPTKPEENKAQEIQSTIKPEIPVVKEITKEETIQETFKGQPIKQEENKSQEIQSDIKPKKPIEREINKETIRTHLANEKHAVDVNKNHNNEDQTESIGNNKIKTNPVILEAEANKNDLKFENKAHLGPKKDKELQEPKTDATNKVGVDSGELKMHLVEKKVTYDPIKNNKTQNIHSPNDFKPVHDKVKIQTEHEKIIDETKQVENKDIARENVRDLHVYNKQLSIVNKNDYPVYNKIVSSESNPLEDNVTIFIDNNSTKEMTVSNRDNDIKSNKEESKDIIEEIPVLKGKVSDLINKLDANKTKDDAMRNEVPCELVPKKKSILSKIAMFERKEPPRAIHRKTPVDIKPKHTEELKIVDIDETVRNPTIGEEILHPEQRGFNNDQNRYEKLITENINVNENQPKHFLVIEDAVREHVSSMYEIENDNKTRDMSNKETEVKPNIKKENEKEFITRKVEPSNLELRTEERLQDARVIKNENEDLILKNKLSPEPKKEYKPKLNEIDDKPKIVDVLLNNIQKRQIRDNSVKATQQDIKPHDEEFKDKQSTDTNKDKSILNITIKHEDNYHSDIDTEVFDINEKPDEFRSKIKRERPKSVAEIDLGDAVKGIVHQMIVRMHSQETLLDRKEIINIKERPRKKSVSEKIALFERKLTAVKADDTRYRQTFQKSQLHFEATSKLNEEQYERIIKDLKSAKTNYGRVEDMLYVELRDGYNMPIISTGTGLLDRRLIPHVISAAIELGYRGIDTAYIYGNEKEVGEAIRAKINDGTVTREELFITSKLWSTFHRPDLVVQACKKSLEVMGLDYFDLYLIHSPMSFKEGRDTLPKIANVLQFSAYDYLDAWFAMEDLVSEGLARSIGVSNFNSVQVGRIVEKGRIKPVLNQVECHPYLTQRNLAEFCNVRDVMLTCYGVLGSKGTPGHLKSNVPPVIDDPLIQVMAAGLGVTPAQLLIRYHIENGHGVVVMAATAAHLWENLQAMSISLEPREMEALEALNRNKRIHTFKGMGDTHKNYPFNIAF